MKGKFRLTLVSFTLSAAFSIAAPVGAAETTTSSPTSSTTSADPTVSRGESKVIGKTADTYSAFAGSRSNAENLATGLRQGSEITLTQTTEDGATTSSAFTPPTKPMGHGNVDKALALSSQQLANAGVAQPTAEQIKTSMMGGTITNDAGQQVELQGVLQMRADGMGWGKIAHELGVKPGQGYKPAHTASGVTPASGASSNVTTAKGKSGSVHSASGDKQPKSSGVGGQGSGVVTASGASASRGSGHISDKGASQRSGHVTTLGGNHAGVTNASGHGNGNTGAVGKGHLK
ncbi:MAG TPA: hypothetical protein VFH31_17820 [Pyrinomonadaceae bacterium]|nr:hypothetical protein [Pyrinomonadaceae bacterium]